FAAPDDEQLKAWRQDHQQFMPRTIWVNPSYEPLPGQEGEITTDVEACFSVHDLAGPVPRYTEIKYTAYLPDGAMVTGNAKGFLARIIQHETDHLDGTLFIDKVSEED